MTTYHLVVETEEDLSEYKGDAVLVRCDAHGNVVARRTIPVIRIQEATVVVEESQDFEPDVEPDDELDL